MATKTETLQLEGQSQKLVEMSWDPITRIVGSLGIYTKIDWANKTVAECHSTSSIFRGYSIFMKGKDPRDAHFITSRICGICGDKHATCSCYTQNMAYGVHPPALGEQIDPASLPADVRDDVTIADFGIRGVHLSYELLNGYDALVLIDAMPLGQPPGTVAVFEPDIESVDPTSVDAHSMSPAVVLGLLAGLGGHVPPSGGGGGGGGLPARDGRRRNRAVRGRNVSTDAGRRSRPAPPC